MKHTGVFLLLALAACTDPLVGGKLSSASVCGGIDDVVPPPTVPTSIRKVQLDPSTLKYKALSNGLLGPLEALSSDLIPDAIIQKGTALTLVVDHACTKKLNYDYTKPRYLSERVMSSETHVIQNAKKNQVRSHTWLADQDMDLRDMIIAANNDSCLKMVSSNPNASTQYTPNDTELGDQDYLTTVKAFSAWDTFYTKINQDVVVAVIDDGNQIDHEDLSNTNWVNTGEIASNGIDDDGNGYIDDVNGYNFASNIADPSQQSGKSHGTHVTGIIAAEENNSRGVAGIMGRRVKVMSLNVFGTAGGAQATNVNNAINYAVANGAEVINMSLGGPGSSAATQTAIQAAAQAGVVVVIAAGNDTEEITSGNFYYPIGYAKDISGAIGVGSIDVTDENISYFSNYSTSYVEIAAPGSDADNGGILSTVPGNIYNLKQGTSMASPVVAGAAALAVGLIKSLDYPVTASRVETLIVDSAVSSSALSSYIKGGKKLDLQSLASLTERCP